MVLFFIFNKIHFMTQSDIVDICKEFYSTADIDVAKALMYEKYGCTDQAKVHRGGNKTHNDLVEMMSFMGRQGAPTCVFCITKCTQVPSVALDFVDAAAMNRHISNVRGEVTVASAQLRRLLFKADVMGKMLEELQSAQPNEHRQGEQTSRDE